MQYGSSLSSMRMMASRSDVSTARTVVVVRAIGASSHAAAGAETLR